MDSASLWAPSILLLLNSGARYAWVLVFPLDWILPATCLPLKRVARVTSHTLRSMWAGLLVGGSSPCTIQQGTWTLAVWFLSQTHGLRRPRVFLLLSLPPSPPLRLDLWFPFENIQLLCVSFGKTWQGEAFQSCRAKTLETFQSHHVSGESWGIAAPRVKPELLLCIRSGFFPTWKRSLADLSVWEGRPRRGLGVTTVLYCTLCAKVLWSQVGCSEASTGVGQN